MREPPVLCSKERTFSRRLISSSTAAISSSRVIFSLLKLPSTYPGNGQNLLTIANRANCYKGFAEILFTRACCLGWLPGGNSRHFLSPVRKLCNTGLMMRPCNLSDLWMSRCGLPPLWPAIWRPGRRVSRNYRLRWAATRPEWPPLPRKSTQPAGFDFRYSTES